ncbi:MAG: FAD-dependent oxidoreductase [Deltaproteobacteria bacterium]|nr:FAD-dependent oxidoreductase [Deltaproteobacteria bacterium]
MFRKLFSPIKINKLEIENRIAMPPFGLLYCGPDRKPSQRLLDFYQARARGGCGLLIVGGVGIDLVGSGVMTPGIDTDERIEDWKKFADAIHSYSTKLFLQLFHAGRYQYSALANGEQSVAPSAVRSRYTNEEPRALSLSEIQDLEDKFALAALRAKKAGVDGVEIIASAGYLICQFLSPLTNKRDDAYGGSFENRTRFGRRVIEKTREAVGSEYPVIMRVAGNEFIPGGNTSRDILEIVQVFEKAGLDGFDVTGGWHETRVPQLPSLVPRGAYCYLAAGIRSRVSVPVFASNRIVEPEQAERILQDGLADVVNIGRAQIADPEWANKAKAGKAWDIRPCVDCLQGCMDMLFTGRPVQCLCNPLAGFEGERKIERTNSPKKVMVIGAGPAGLEAAVTASKCGHAVTLYEMADEIGGQLPLVAAPPGREEFARLMDYYRAQIKQSRIKLKLGKQVNIKTIRKDQPDSVILATGSRQVVPEIPGIDRPEVVNAWDALLRRVDLGRTVAVLGGGAVGIETAIALAERGTISGETLKFLLKHGAEEIDVLKELVTRGTRKVYLLEMLNEIGKDVGRTNRWVFVKELRLLGVEIITNATVVAVTDRGVIYKKDDQEVALKVDNLVLALGATSNDELEDALTKAQVAFAKVGDVKQPRQILNAIHEGFLAATAVGS